MAKRELDILVFGATGYTGRQVTKHLVQIMEKEQVKFAIAGRNKEKLDALLKDSNAPSSVQSFVADAGNSSQLDAIIPKATIVIACAGPFQKVGMPIVDACVKAGTHYVDITGENVYVREMIEKHQDAASTKGVKLVPQSGFDSIPGDLCNYLVNDYAREQKTSKVSDVVSFYKVGGGGFSRGTLDSAMNAMTTMTKKDFSQVSLNPQDKRKGVKVNAPWVWPWYVPGIGWTTAFFMAFANNKVVRRSNAFLGFNSSYDEAMKVGGVFQATMVSVFLVVFMILTRFAPVRKLIQKFGPGAGEGPQGVDNNGFTVIGRGKCENGQIITAKLKSKINAYPATAIFAVQTALAIAHDIERDSQSTGNPSDCPTAGVLTPMTAVGKLLIPRLNRNSMNVELGSISKL